MSEGSVCVCPTQVFPFESDSLRPERLQLREIGREPPRLARALNLRGFKIR